jgi:heme/copper-type cytochrome/quinol oxidase subunit 1
MFFAGLEGQPVDIFRYYEDDGVSTLNLIASLGAFVLVIGMLLELGNLAASYTGGRPVGHDPWRGSTLEWFALSPPPAHNFDAVPDVRSSEPLRDIREAIRAREGAYVAPAPLERGAPSPAAPVPAGAVADELQPSDEGPGEGGEATAEGDDSRVS